MILQYLCLTFYHYSCLHCLHIFVLIKHRFKWCIYHTVVEGDFMNGVKIKAFLDTCTGISADVL